MENDYDSINLASTVKSQIISNLGNNEPTSNLLVSVANDENEYELDPEEFISSKEEDKIDEDQLIGSLSSVLESVTKPPVVNQNYNEPIQHLAKRIQYLQQDLLEKSHNYPNSLSTGDNIDQLRKSILQIFHQLSECHYSLNELYLKDATYTRSIEDYFKSWDIKREKVLKKIKHIKSDQSQYGSKLVKLINESNDLDEEIDALQMKLSMMKEKKLLLNKEIESATSIIESKTSSYIEGFKNLESQGKDVLYTYLQNDGISEAQIATLVKQTPIDLSFSVPVNVTKENPISASEAKQEAPGPVMGMQPYNPEPNTSTTPPSEMNHDHGPTAYEKGYIRGSQNSSILKQQIQDILNKFVHTSTPNANNRTNSKLNEYSNTLVSQLDIDTIKAYLLHRFQALNDQVLTTSRQAAIFNEYDKQWSNVQQVLTSQEENLESILSQSTTNSDKTPILKILKSTKESLIKLCNINEDAIFSDFINDEIEAIEKGISLISEETNHVANSKKKN